MEIEFIKIVCVLDGLVEGLNIRKGQEYYGFGTVDGVGYNVYTDIEVEKEKGKLPNYIGSYPKQYFQLIDNETHVVTFEKNA
ncbi:hypothetical protein [Priestia megaterium]|jgi:hypothetical protein|uniref:hypothetical protein n=1 Tax=Priestia megaterium TaxID=1404 RepID=UPI002E22B988|nr:hypothetical protein [Priestia megaterium]MED4278686.1 hypothetical protein [Priestia megaterium]MED4292657.1 hypothetical protein [Priestia megaterium]MED4298728.1 hypothetical protein [Priestia megaterium]MED4319848.1 hypothetical protein [Priestia megaterium]